MFHNGSEIKKIKIITNVRQQISIQSLEHSNWALHQSRLNITIYYCIMVIISIAYSSRHGCGSRNHRSFYHDLKRKSANVLVQVLDCSTFRTILIHLVLGFLLGLLLGSIASKICLASLFWGILILCNSVCNTNSDILIQIARCLNHRISSLIRPPIRLRNPISAICSLKHILCITAQGSWSE